MKRSICRFKNVVKSFKRVDDEIQFDWSRTAWFFGQPNACLIFSFFLFHFTRTMFVSRDYCLKNGHYSLQTKSLFKWNSFEMVLRLRKEHKSKGSRIKSKNAHQNDAFEIEQDVKKRDNEEENIDWFMEWAEHAHQAHLCLGFVTAWFDFNAD